MIDRQSYLGIGKSALAQQSGVSRKMLYLFEQGQSDFSVDKLIAVAGALGLRVELVEEIHQLPADYRAQKTQKRLDFIKNHPEEAAEGFCQNMKIGKVVIPNIGGDDW
ncbi:helix-turn-helix domain-containing protein [Propionivibrio sp.]|uniref:helix-turn-helix domain-containing protein n=1 Tax=Propionivibrio sp. TaxID=2212460 RepID=UPI003BF2BDEF